MQLCAVAAGLKASLSGKLLSHTAAEFVPTFSRTLSSVSAAADDSAADSNAAEPAPAGVLVADESSTTPADAGDESAADAATTMDESARADESAPADEPAITKPESEPFGESETTADESATTKPESVSAAAEPAPASATEGLSNGHATPREVAHTDAAAEQIEKGGKASNTVADSGRKAADDVRGARVPAGDIGSPTPIGSA